jgi:hypothetical protein
MMEKATRAWCVKCQFSGKNSFILGTIYADKNAKHAEVLALCQTEWAELFPFAAPPSFVPIPGIIIFHGE